MDEFVFVTRVHGGDHAWLIRVSRLGIEAERLGINLVCCEFASLPAAMQNYYQRNIADDDDVYNLY